MINYLINKFLTHNILWPCGLVPWPWKTSFIFHGSLKQTGIIQLLFIHSYCIWKFGWSFTPNNMRKSYCSYKEYSFQLLIKVIVPTLFTMFSLSNRHYSLFVLASTSSYFGTFFPWRLDNGGPCWMLNIECNTTMQLNNTIQLNEIEYCMNTCEVKDINLNIII